MKVEIENEYHNAQVDCVKPHLVPKWKTSNVREKDVIETLKDKLVRWM